MTRRFPGWTCAALCLGLAAAASTASAALPPDALRTVRRIAVQDHGRIKPFDSFSRESLQHITGSPRYGAEDPADTVLAIMAEPEPWQARPLVDIPFRPLREALGMDPHAPRISYDDLVASRKLMRMLPAIVEKQQREEKLTMLEQETMDAFERFVSFSGLIEQKISLVPPPSAGDPVWRPVLEPSGHPNERQAAVREAWTALLADVRAGRAGAVGGSALRLTELLRAANPSAYPPDWRIDLEVFYNRFNPFHAARLFYLAAILGLLVHLVKPRPRAAGFGMAVLWGGVLLHATGILMRVVLGGRPPVSNFYETTLWLPFVAVVLALVFERVYRVTYFGLAAAMLAGIMLTLADHLPLDSSISPVVAVLRSNLWLTIHVLTIVGSYGALALATVLAHIYGALFLARPRGNRQVLASLDLFLYRTLQVGVVLLAGGVMLGAVWANASWGRYWGWDPKETWALITLLWFLAVLHGRFAGWLRGIGVVLSTLGGFLLLLMTYYGVSFYLVGLHSYAGGSAKPIPALLIGYLVFEAAFALAVGVAALRRSRLTRA